MILVLLSRPGGEIDRANQFTRSLAQDTEIVHQVSRQIAVRFCVRFFLAEKNRHCPATRLYVMPIGAGGRKVSDDPVCNLEFATIPMYGRS